MLRLCCSSPRAMVSRTPPLLHGKISKPSVRHFSSGGGGRAKILGTTLVVSAGTLGGAVGYSALDPDFRKIVEENVPGSSQLLELLVGEKEPTAPISPVLKMPKITSSVMITKPMLDDKPSTSVLPTLADPTDTSELTTAVETPASPVEKPTDLVSTLELPVVLEAPSPPMEELQVPAPELPNAADSEVQSALTVPAPPMEEPEVPASAPVLSTTLEVPASALEEPESQASATDKPEHPASTPQLPTVDNPASPLEKHQDPASAPELPVLLEVPAPTIEKPEAPGSSTELPNVLEDHPSSIEPIAPISAPVMSEEIESPAPLEKPEAPTDLLPIALEAPAPALEEPESPASGTELPTVDSASELKSVLTVPAPPIEKLEAPVSAPVLPTVSEIPVYPLEEPDAPVSNAELPAEITLSLEVPPPPPVVEPATADASTNDEVVNAEVTPVEIETKTANNVLEEPEAIASATELPAVLEDSGSPSEKPKADDSASDLQSALNVLDPHLETPEAPTSEVPPLPPVEEPATVESSTIEEVVNLDTNPVEVEPETIEPTLPHVEEPATVESSTTEEVVNVDTTPGEVETETIEPTEADATDCISEKENKSLEELMVEMQELVASAISETEASTDSVTTHVNVMQKVLELNLTVKDDSAWNEMFLAAQDRSEKAEAAELREKEALVAITNVMESINDQKNNGISTDSDLVVAEEAANNAIYQMDKAKDMRALAENEAKVMENYKDLVDAGKEQLHKEMASIMPDVNLGEKNGQLTEYELNIFITHAYKKVIFLQQEVAKQQTLEQARFKKALVKQRMEIQNQAMDHMEGELERQARELQVVHEEKMADIQDAAEEKLRTHLKRQAAAHTDHVHDTLAIQEDELTRKQKHQMAEQFDSLSKTHADSLANLTGTVSGINEAMEARVASDSASLSAQNLWLACTSLNTTINLGREDATTWEEKLQPLTTKVEQVKMAAGASDKFVEVVLATISPVAMERGVYTEDSLKERFCVVEKLARRVAGIGEEGGSLLGYGLSYLQSLLVFNLADRTQIDISEEVELAKVSPTVLVNMAKHSLDQGNLVRAVQLMTQLKGEPARVATDWVAEARLTLETKQAVQAIMLHSQANSCQNMPGV
eukprot:GFUD01063666.1.p1 GENE.GFUD01063666.1~~GFUD01063666.1.p1  ORF type:complete len:1125 (-),score=395.18 GFUD01063666.1:153-3527(-)